MLNPRHLILSSLLACPALIAQDRAAEVLRPTTPVDINPAEVYAHLVAVKFVEGHKVRLHDRGLHSNTLDLAAARELLENYKVSRMFTRPVAELEKERADLQKAADTQLADLNNYYFVTTRGERDTEALLNALLGNEAIETAYAEPIPVPMGDLSPPTGDFESRQTYLGSAPGGHGHWLTRSIDGAQGLPNQTVAQLEGAWVLGHEDAEELVAGNIIGTRNFGPYNTATWYQHGTACFGIINASRNNYGVRGFAPLAKGRVSSLANGSANMISMTTGATRAGDALTSSFAYVVGGNHVPLDNSQANFDAVKICTAKGVCYTFSAGNTGKDLATLSNRYLANAPESGGFIIGGTNGSRTTRASGSNYGAKVVANGWYSSVTTLGYGNLFYPGNDNRQAYTRSFGGTSAAAPQVAGVIASIQGAAKRQLNGALSAARIRNLLKTYGTDVTGTIGKRPDLNKIMTSIGALDGLRISREATLGGQIGMEVKMDAGRQYIMFASLGRATSSVGLNRRVLLDLNTLFVFLSSTMNGTGTQNYTFNVPNSTSLRGKSLYMQTLDFSGASQHLSNSVDAYIK